MDDDLTPSQFGGAPGTAVPEVDPADIAAVWKKMQDVKKRHPNGGVAIGLGVLQRICKDGADVKAVAFRSMMVSTLQFCAPDQWLTLVKDDALNERALLATAQIPMQWIDFGKSFEGFPFDPETFFRIATGEN